MKEIIIDGVTYSLTPKENLKQEPKLPKTWEELKEIKGYYVDSSAYVVKDTSWGGMKQTFVTKEQAEASIALAQLSQLLKVYQGDWTPDWSANDKKYCVFFNQDNVDIHFLKYSNSFLSFPTQELAQEFLDNFRDLIEKAKPLL